LVGPKPTAAVRALSSFAGVEVVGYVPDLRDEIAHATAVLVPLRIGTGTKNKILQALSMGRPVVTTSTGNEGLDAVSGQHLLVADTPASFAEAIVRLHDGGEWREDLGTAGHDWVSSHYGLAAVTATLEAVLNDVVAGQRATKGVLT
jgi:glycosyltransferase involved in cell wall biosynthesis